MCYLALTERSFEKSTSFQTECLQLSLSQSLLFYQIMQHDDSSSTQDEVMHLGQHFNNIRSTNAKPDENCAENPLPAKRVRACMETAEHTSPSENHANAQHGLCKAFITPQKSLSILQFLKNPANTVKADFPPHLSALYVFHTDKHVILLNSF